MKLTSKNINILLLIPCILEAIDSSKLLVVIPGSPLSLGRLCFVLVGIRALNNITKLKNNGVVFAFVLIQLGLFLGAAFSTDVSGNLSKTIAFTSLIFSATTISFYWRDISFQKLINISMLALFSYWATYILTNLISGNKLLVYSSLFSDDEVVNHHVSGLKISISGIYLASRLLGLSKVKNFLAYFIILISITLCLLIESRSNTAFTMIAGLILYFTNNKKLGVKFIVFTIPMFLIAIFIYFNYVSNIEVISSRFDVSNVDYQQRTTESRFILINLSFESLINQPFGRGITDIKLKFSDYRNFLPHNQYLTFIIAGGIFSLIGIFIWIRNLFKLSKLIFLKRWKAKTTKTETALLINVLVFYMTITTVDFTGLLFFIQLSFTIYLMSRYKEIQWNLKYNKKR